MKFRAQWFAAAAVLLPLGVAVAEYAGENEVPAAPAGVQDMLQVAEKVARSIAGARQQLKRAADVARKDDDQLLLSCLLDKLQSVQKLEAMASQSLGELQRSSDEASAQRPFVVLTVLGQKVTLTMQEAAACVDSKNTNGAVSIQSIAPPSPPETDYGFGSDLPAVDDFDVLPPPTAVGTETDFDPSTDMEPPIASPIR